MGSEGHREGLVEMVERLLARLQAEEQHARPAKIVKVAEGWYNRLYLTERLPAELARSEESGRPFSVGMFRFVGGDGKDAPADWRASLCALLTPVEVGCATGDDELVILYPEKDDVAAAARHNALMEQIADELSLDLSHMHSSLICFRPKRVTAGQWQKESDKLLSELEKGLTPFAEESVNDTDDDEAEEASASAKTPDASGDDDASDGRRAGNKARSSATGKAASVRNENGADASLSEVAAAADEESRLELVALGFASGRRLPVSLWHDNELLIIEAVINESKSPTGGRSLEVKTRKGEHHLVEQDGRWYIKV